MRNVSEVAQGAIDALNKYGWIQGDGGNKFTGFCILGAINYSADVYDTPDTHYAEFKACRNAVATAIMQRNYGLAQWNDDSGRTKDEVIAALQKVIDNERNNRD